MLTTQHIFREVAPDRFANNRITQALVDDEKLQAQVKCRSVFLNSGLANVASRC